MTIVEKEFSITITGDALQLFGKRKKLIMKYKLSKNGTFKCNIQTTKEVFLTSNDEPLVVAHKVWTSKF